MQFQFMLIDTLIFAIPLGIMFQDWNGKFEMNQKNANKFIVSEEK